MNIKKLRNYDCLNTTIRVQRLTLYKSNRLCCIVHVNRTCQVLRVIDLSKPAIRGVGIKQFIFKQRNRLE